MIYKELNPSLQFQKTDRVTVLKTKLQSMIQQEESKFGIRRFSLSNSTLKSCTSLGQLLKISWFSTFFYHFFLFILLISYKILCGTNCTPTHVKRWFVKKRKTGYPNIAIIFNVANQNLLLANLIISIVCFPQNQNLHLTESESFNSLNENMLEFPKTTASQIQRTN